MSISFFLFFDYCGFGVNRAKAAFFESVERIHAL